MAYSRCQEGGHPPQQSGLSAIAQLRMNAVFTSFAATTVIQLVTMLSGVLTARILLPIGKGELAAVILWPSLLAYVGNMGLVDAVAFYAADSEQDIGQVLASGLAIALPLSGVLFGIGHLILPIVLANQAAGTLETARLYLIYIPLNLITLSLTSILWGRMRLVAYNFLRAFVHVGFVSGIVLLYALGQVSVRRFVEASSAAVLVTMLMAGGVILKNRWLSWWPDVQIIKRLLAYGWRVHLGSIASLANLRLDQMLMSVFLPPRELGLYVVAVSVSGIVNLAANTLVIVVFPRVANLALGSEKALMLGRFVRLALVLSVLAAVGAFVLVPWILSVFFTTAYLPATEMGRVLIVASIPLGLNTVLEAGIKAFGRPLKTSQAELLGLIISGIGLWALLPRFGALGAAWVSLLAYSTVSVFLLYVLRHELRITTIGLLRPTSNDWQYILHQCRVLSTQMRVSLKQ